MMTGMFIWWSVGVLLVVLLVILIIRMLRGGKA
jgi:hypothetical protein